MHNIHKILNFNFKYLKTEKIKVYEYNIIYKIYINFFTYLDCDGLIKL